MVFPNVSEVLDDFEQTITKRVITIVTVEFEEVETVVESSIRAVVQVAEKENLKVENIDWSLQYVWVHSKTELDINNEVVWSGRTFKVIAREDYNDYGYYAVVGEEVKDG